MSDCFDHAMQAYDEFTGDGQGWDLPSDWRPVRRERYTRFCKHCHTGGLEWFETDGKWRLRSKDGIPHTCVKYSRGTQIP